MDKAKRYHHGNLVEALLAATVEIIEERGVDQVSVREAAKRAGVSPGAPFRHFRSKTALMTAVAEQAMTRLTQAVAEAQAAVGMTDPLVAFGAIGQGYLTWALSNPTHFEILSSRTLIDFGSSETLRAQNDALRQLMVGLLTEAREQGQIKEDLDFDHLVLGARALVYGLARMVIDGHFPEWHATEAPNRAVNDALHVFISQIATK